MKKGFKEHWEQQEAVQKALAALEGAIDTAIVSIRAEGIKEVDAVQKDLLVSIPGIGDTLAATIVSEVGDIKRFRNVKAFIAFAGLDPKVRQSGTSLNRNSKITKRGSPYLRRAAYIGASIAQRYDVSLKEYHLKKRVEGKRYKEATVANARHLLARAYAVLKRGTPYVVHR
jgi:transposase